MRMNHDLFEAWRIGSGVDAGRVTINPGDHRPESVVIVGVHRRIAGVSVPALPPGRCALRQHVAPRRIGFVQQRRYATSAASVIGEGEEKERRSKKSRGQVPVPRLDIFYQSVDQSGSSDAGAIFV